MRLETTRKKLDSDQTKTTRMHSWGYPYRNFDTVHMPCYQYSQLPRQDLETCCWRVLIRLGSRPYTLKTRLSSRGNAVPDVSKSCLLIWYLYWNGDLWGLLCPVISARVDKRIGTSRAHCMGPDCLRDMSPIELLWNLFGIFQLNVFLARWTVLIINESMKQPLMMQPLMLQWLLGAVNRRSRTT